MQLKTITELLARPNYKVAGIVPADKQEHLHFLLEQIKITAPVCSGCEHVHHNSVHSTTIVVVEDMRTSGKILFFEHKKTAMLLSMTVFCSACR